MLKRGLFVTGQLDNVDDNPSTTSTQSSFHGTALSLIWLSYRDDLRCCNWRAAIGEWLDGSGWTSVKTTGGVTTEGRVMNLQKGSTTARYHLGGLYGRWPIVVICRHNACVESIVMNKYVYIWWKCCFVLKARVGLSTQHEFGPKCTCDTDNNVVLIKLQYFANPTNLPL